MQISLRLSEDEIFKAICEYVASKGYREPPLGSVSLTKGTRITQGYGGDPVEVDCFRATVHVEEDLAAWARKSLSQSTS